VEKYFTKKILYFSELFEKILIKVPKNKKKSHSLQISEIFTLEELPTKALPKKLKSTYLRRNLFFSNKAS
jgi:hypothetical protein